MMSKRAYRYTQSLLLFSAIVVVALTFYFEYAKGLEPCPLCLMQRLSAFLFGTFCLMGMTLGTLRRARSVAVLQLFFAGFGLFFATRQMWLQSLPADQAPMCMPGLDVLMRYFSWDVVLKALFWGTADCGEVTWRWLGLSMPTWSALYFLAVLIASGLIFWRIGKSLTEQTLSR